MGRLAKDEEGQAFVEYMLMILVALGIVTAIAQGFRGSIMKFWRQMAKEVSAACPTCPTKDPQLGGGT